MNYMADLNYLKKKRTTLEHLSAFFSNCVVIRQKKMQAKVAQNFARIMIHFSKFATKTLHQKLFILIFL